MRITSAVFILLVAGTATKAQTTDNWLWPSVQVEKRFFSDLTVSLNAEARLNENYSNLRAFFGEAEFNWKFNKYLSASANYRLGGRQDDISDYAKGQRITLFAYGKLKVWKLSLTNRAGVYRQYLTSRQTPRDYFRNKFTVKLDASKKLNPLAYIEFFYRFDNDPNYVDEWRYGGGVDYDINKQHGLKALFIYSKQVNVKRPDLRNVISLTYTYKIKSKGKKEEPGSP